MSHNITIEGGTSVRLPTSGKYCDRDIVITATGSGSAPEDLKDVLDEQAELIATLQATLQNKAGGSEVVEPVLQEKTVTPTTAAQSVTPDSGYDGLSKVTVNAMPTATQATPSISVNSSGLITASATQTAGYVAAGTKSATKQLTTQAAKTITPSTSSQTAVASGVYTTGAITVAAIPSDYVKPSATKGATTYTPSTSNQTIAAGTYCSGAQTIKGDANLQAGNIKKGVSIFGVYGSYEGSGSGGGSSGGSVETCTVTIINSLYSAHQDTTLIMWLDGSLTIMSDYLPSEPKNAFAPTTHTYTVAKGTFFCSIYGWSAVDAGDATLAGSDFYGLYNIAVINGDCTISIG